MPKKIWVPTLIMVIAGALFLYNRPVAIRKAVLMSTPLVVKEGLIKPYNELPDDITPPVVDVFYATDRQPSDISLLYPVFYGNDRSMSLSLGTARVRMGTEEMRWEEIKKLSRMKARTKKVPLQILDTDVLHKIGSASKSLDDSLYPAQHTDDRFLVQIEKRLSNSDRKTIYIFVPGFKVDFTYPVLVAAELWHFMGYPGAFIAYSWPSRQRIRDYFSDIETAAFTAQHFRMLLIYLAENTSAENIHILSYSAGARIVSQALHELQLMAHGIDIFRLRKALKIGQVVFTAPDIDLMLFAARYRDGFENMAEAITIYTNNNDTALNWALRFFGWPRLGAPGEFALTPEDLRSLYGSEKTVLIDVSAAEDTASGNGHGYFIKSPWVSTDLLLTLLYGVEPKSRGLFKKSGDTVWSFPRNYPERIRQMAEKMPGERF